MDARLQHVADLVADVLTEAAHLSDTLDTVKARIDQLEAGGLISSEEADALAMHTDEAHDAFMAAVAKAEGLVG